MTRPASCVAGDPALELARELGYAHLLYPGTLSTRRPRGTISLDGEATSEMVHRWKTVDFKDRNIAWLLRSGWFHGRIMAYLDTDTLSADINAQYMLPDTPWKAETGSGYGHYHRYYLLADNIEEYQFRGYLDEIDLKVGMNEYVVAPMNPGYRPGPGFGQGEPALLTAAVWNVYIGHMMSISSSKKPEAPAKAKPATGDGGELCPNHSQGLEDYHQCCGESASPWRNFLGGVTTRFVYNCYNAEGETPTLERTLIYVQAAHDNNRCQEHEYRDLTKLVTEKHRRACSNASKEGKRESHRRWARRGAEKRWEPLREAIVQRNSSIIIQLASGLTQKLVAEANGVCDRTVRRVIQQARDGIPLTQPA